MTAGSKQFVFDEEPNVRREIRQGSEVEVFKDFVLLDVEKVRRDFRLRTAPEAALVQFSQYQAEQGRRDRRLAGVGISADNILDDAIFNAWWEEGRAQSNDLPGLSFAHRKQSQSILPESAEVGPDAVEIGEVILSHRQKHLERRSLEIKSLGPRRIFAECGGGAILNQICQFNDERGRLRHPCRRFSA